MLHFRNVGYMSRGSSEDDVVLRLAKSGTRLYYGTTHQKIDLTSD